MIELLADADMNQTINTLLQATGMTGTAGAMFWLVVWLLKDRRKELREERLAHYNELVKLAAVQETYNLLMLERLGVPAADRQELARQSAKKVEEAMSRAPKRDSDLQNGG